MSNEHTQHTEQLTRDERAAMRARCEANPGEELVNGWAALRLLDALDAADSRVQELEAELEPSRRYVTYLQERVKRAEDHAVDVETANMAAEAEVARLREEIAALKRVFDNTDAEVVISEQVHIYRADGTNELWHIYRDEGENWLTYLCKDLEWRKWPEDVNDDERMGYPSLVDAYKQYDLWQSVEAYARPDIAAVLREGKDGE
ncbi:MAG: hypothetical protein ACM3SS_00735 [Rhodospirillaceae bacterium]